jgi:PAS domain S-box-containing protein
MSRILIVDDDPKSLYMLESLLKGHEYKVMTAVNGKEAIKKARRSKPDLIISDFFMPTMDGFALCRECKTDDRLKDVPFIAYTATYTDPKDEELALGLGAARFLIKPVEPEVLLREVEQILAHSKAGRLPPPPEPAREEQYLREYNEALIRKMEKKVAQFQEANRALQESEAQFRAMFELASIGMAQADPQTGQWLRVNKKMCDITGYSAEEMLTMRVSEITYPEDRAADWAAFQRVVRGETADYRMEKRYIRKDGTRAWVNVNMTILRDADGQPFRTMATIEDITERKQAEEAIARSEERYRTLIESSTDYIYTVTVANGQVGQTVHGPGCLGVTGYTPEEYRADGQLWLRMVPDEDRPAVLQQAQSLTRGQKVGPLEHRLVHKDGSLRWVRNTPVLHFDTQGRLTGYEGLVQDITEHRKLLEQLLQSQKMEAIGMLAGGIAHDFRNQLTVIIGYGEMLTRRGLVKDKALECVQQILKAAERSAELSSQLLAFSRQQELRPEVVNVDNVIAGLSKSLVRMVGEDVRLSITPSVDVGNVRIDPGQFQQALVNLVVNARDAMPQGGQVAIETFSALLDEDFVRHNVGASTGPHVVVSVTDTGIGMDKDTLKKCFEPFFTTKPVGQGTGLGLSMVYGFVKQSNGYVSVQSEPGHGSTFQLYLPEVLDEAKRATAENAVADRLPDGSGTILLVEDEADVRHLVSQTLRECGYTVLEAASAEDTMPLIDRYEGPIDILVSDVVMPGMNGPELAARFLSKRPGTPVLYLSGYTGKALAIRGVLPAEVNLLRKPVRASDLARTVRKLLHDKR